MRSCGVYDVAIVGYGPVGEVLANLLGQEGFRVAVFERAESVYHMPRAAHFDHEVMRVFQSIGLADAILPSTSWIRGMHFLNGERRKLFGFEQPDRPTANGWSNDYMFYQPDLELALRSGVDRFDNVEVFLRHEVDAVTDFGDHVEVVVRNLDGDTLHTVDARFVVGCDGARSSTRRLVGIDLEDIGFDESWLVIDARLTRAVDLPDVCHQICDPARPTTYVPMPEPYRRWEFMLLPGETVEEIEKPDRVRELLAPWVSDADAEIIRAVVYTFHAVIAHGWRTGRVVIAGDAAHQMPPFLGQGMCSGIRDAANLAWKLALVLRGLAPDALLDTYEAERAPHVRTIIDAAVSFGGIICTLDPQVAADRDRQFLENPDGPGSRTQASQPPLGSAGLGVELFVQPWVTRAEGGDALFDDVAGRGFTLVSRAGDPLGALQPGTRAAFDALGGTALSLDHVGDRDGYLGAWFDRQGCEVALVRPDRYVFGTAASIDGCDALVTALVTVLERVPQPSPPTR